jgi:nickel-dependent lactate racemase
MTSAYRSASTTVERLLDFPLPGHFRVTVAESRPVPTLDAGRFSLDDITAVGERRLPSLVRQGMRVTIAFTDATRSCPDRLLVGALIDELLRLGVIVDDITLLCATGMHRPITRDEQLAKLGAEIAGKVRIVSHDALDSNELVDLGEIDGLPVVVNRRCIETDLLLATGVVEPHQYAGYSGGAKTVVIGCGGEATVRETHGAGMLDRPGTRLGAVESNPFQSFVRKAGERIGLRYVLNVLLDEHGGIVEAAEGEPVAVHDHLVGRGREIYEVMVERAAHIAIAGVSPSKSVNLYQASRAATYLALADRTPLRPGAPIILPASIPEGAGEGTGEKRFHRTLAESKSPAELIGELCRTGFPAGAQRAYILAQTLLQHPIIVVGAEHPDIVRDCHMLAASDLESGLALAGSLARDRFGIASSGELDLLVVPNALVTMPKLGGTIHPSSG